MLLGAPTGSGKTIAAEIAMFRVFNEQPDAKVKKKIISFYMYINLMKPYLHI